MRDLNRDFKQLGQRNRDGSFGTQATREAVLTLVANQLHEGGFRHLPVVQIHVSHGGRHLRQTLMRMRYALGVSRRA